MVTHPTTSSAITGLSLGERTGSRVLQYLWSYVIEVEGKVVHTRSRMLAVRVEPRKSSHLQAQHTLTPSVAL